MIKLGAEGAQAWTADGQTARSRAFAVTPIDTVGAGDGFAAGYLAAFLSGGSLQERVDQGAAVGALATTRRGDLARHAGTRRGRRLDSTPRTASRCTTPTWLSHHRRRRYAKARSSNLIKTR